MTLWYIDSSRSTQRLSALLPGASRPLKLASQRQAPKGPFTADDVSTCLQAHLAHVTSVKQVEAVMALLKQNNKIARATHNILAYRIKLPSLGSWISDADDDGEAQVTVLPLLLPQTCCWHSSSSSLAAFIYLSSFFGLQAGGRLLHLLQVVNASDVMVVVSRWYGKTVAQSLCPL